MRDYLFLVSSSEIVDIKENLAIMKLYPQNHRDFT
jgi:hypothetical protein